MILPKTEEEIKNIRKAGKIVAEFLEKVEKLMRPGISAKQIDELAWEIAKKRGGHPSFYGYRGYPASSCVSINNEVIHGIPYKEKILKEGDVVSIDYGVIYNGFHADAAKTFIVGDVDGKIKLLVEVTEKALLEAIKFLKHGVRTGDLGNVIESYVKKYGFSVVKEYCGHGIGRELHEDPPILNYGKPGEGIVLVENMTICIEPMVCAGSGKVKVLKDGWTVVSEDGSISAHFEHTVRVGEQESEILTQ